MSHFTVAIITESLEKVEELLAPYQENNMGDCPKQYLDFNDMEVEERPKWETESIEKIKLVDGSLVWPWDYNGDKRNLPEGVQQVNVPYRELYPTFDEFMSEYHGYKKNEETGKYGYWENPNAKWDWYTIGGRWSDSLLLKSGKRADAAQIKDIFFIEKTDHEGLTVDIEGYQVPATLAPEFQIMVAEAAKAWEEMMAGRSFYRPEYILKRYGDKQSYIREVLSFTTYAVITPDGEWHAKGDMGWFGMGSESPEEARNFNKSYFDTFIKASNPDHYLVVVDCHI